MTVESTIQRAHREIEAGRLWRAKEILGSSLAVYGHSRDIFAAYADVLLAMGDDLDAGRFYLLAVDEPDSKQERVMTLFLRRYGHETWQQLTSWFPHAARISKRDDYPIYLRKHLSVLQAPEVLTPRPGPSSDITFWHAWVLPIGCMAIALLIAACTLVGVYTVARWILDLV